LPWEKKPTDNSWRPKSIPAVLAVAKDVAAGKVLRKTDYANSEVRARSSDGTR